LEIVDRRLVSNRRAPALAYKAAKVSAANVGG
jgi:hypothetical protein